MMAAQLVKKNDHGQRIGDSHPRSKVSDHEIELMRHLDEEGMPRWQLAEIFEVSRAFVTLVCDYHRRP